MSVFPGRSSRTRPAGARYAVVVIVVAGASALRGLLVPLLGEGVPFILYFPSVVVCSWFGGLGPGLLSVALGGFVAWYVFIPPAYSLAAADPTAPAQLAVFLFAGVLISGLAESLHRARQAAERQGSAERAVHLEAERLHESERRARGERDSAEERLRLALEAGRMGTWQWTIGTGRVQWSAGLEAIHGWPPGRFPGTIEAFEREIHPDDRDRVLRSIAEVLEDGREHHVEYRIVRPDGVVRWVEGRGHLFRDAEVRPERMIGVCTDVTERKQSEERVRLVIEAAPAAILLVDPGGNIALANALAEQLFGYARHEIIGQPVERLVPPRQRSAHAAHRAGFFVRPERRPMGTGRDLRALRKDGTEVPVEIGLSPVQTDAGVHVLAAITDITERAQREQERAELLARERWARADAEAARQEAESANRTKDEFLALLSHELRSPLNAILGWLALMSAQRERPESIDRGIETIERNSRLLAGLVDDLLDVSSIVAGRLRIEGRRVTIEPVVRAVVEAMRPLAAEKGIALGAVVDSSSGDVWGDPNRLHQVVGNLVSNAIKFTPPGGAVEVRAEGGGSEVTITVTDTGQGIGPEFLPHVFERFRQEDGPAGRHRGLGLGLAVVHHLAELHGGKVTVESAGRGQGARFTVRLPALGPGDARERAGPEERR